MSSLSRAIIKFWAEKPLPNEDVRSSQTPHSCPEYWHVEQPQIRKEAELYESKSSAKKASRLVKLLIEVERALNSAEAAEIASQFEGAVMAQYMRDAGLRFLPSPPPPPVPLPENVTDGETVSETAGKTNKIPSASKEVAFDYCDDTRKDQHQRLKSPGETESRGEGAEVVEKGGAKEGNPLEAFVLTVMGGCEVQCLVMVDDRDKRLVVAVGDALTGEALFASLFEEPAVVHLASYGLMRETAYVNRVAFQVAIPFSIEVCLLFCAFVSI